MTTLKHHVHKAKTARKTAAKKSAGKLALLIGTRKGAFILYADARRQTWRVTGPHFLGQVINHIVLDPRDRRTLLCAVKPGHLGASLFRSLDFGKTWKEAKQPPAFAKAKKGKKGRTVSHVFWLSPGHVSEHGVWYAGTSPQGLFRSEDGGDVWESVTGFNNHPKRADWCGDEQATPPDGATLHSINVDPLDLKHIYIAMSSGGVFESMDGGRDWKPLNKGQAADFLPSPDAEYGHDVHCLRLHPLKPDRLYQQNHCGIYRMNRAAAMWERIGNNMSKKVGDIGFPIALHPRDAETIWVFPMDGSTVWPRVSPDGKPACYISRNGGDTWKRLDDGLPRSQGWFTVKRQSLCTDERDPVHVYFGTTSGEVWMGSNEGKRWENIARHLPHIYSVEAVEFP